MSHPLIIALLALIVAFGPSLFYKIRWDRAEESLRALLAGRFVLQPCPVAKIVIPSGGHVVFFSAYVDTLGSSFVLMLGNRVWKDARGGAYQRVAGLFKPGGNAAWAERVRELKGVIVAAAVEGGALVLWKGLPTGESILSHIEAASAVEPKES
ncbi:MAG TPA: hypothetical protein VKV95_00575 [Terriglobia bacterium]|nr:hypothetical protein [Terriglobia bacterium]